MSFKKTALILIILLSFICGKEINPIINKQTNCLYIKDVNGKEYKFGTIGETLPDHLIYLQRDIEQDKIFDLVFDVAYNGRSWTMIDQHLGKMEYGPFYHPYPYDLPDEYLSSNDLLILPLGQNILTLESLAAAEADPKVYLHFDLENVGLPQHKLISNVFFSLCKQYDSFV